MTSSSFHRRSIDNTSLQFVCELLLPLAKIAAQSLYETEHYTHKKRMKEKKKESRIRKRQRREETGDKQLKCRRYSVLFSRQKETDGSKHSH
ncbi:hypothetical protein CEXT_517231 [Caerostris extrusa]|uniref:Uncharacterized protein n=1 Tax=Caerostris extrusa TaxID=172846 RepID=A0AAV4N1E1_CAEEX|nr:hypothetical protein CEXT_517231 [Caerostris extrusa]